MLTHHGVLLSVLLPVLNPSILDNFLEYFLRIYISAAEHMLPNFRLDARPL
jgi:hypothetical protein